MWAPFVQSYMRPLVFARANAKQCGLVELLSLITEVLLQRSCKSQFSLCSQCLLISVFLSAVLLAFLFSWHSPSSCSPNLFWSPCSPGTQRSQVVCSTSELTFTDFMLIILPLWALLWYLIVPNVFWSREQFTRVAAWALRLIVIHVALLHFLRDSSLLACFD